MASKKEPTPKATDTRCCVKGCGGTLWNVTSRLGEGLGLLQLKCDKCARQWGVKVTPNPAK